ncbi:nuclear body protein SP140-like protein isoform X2 [Phyllostomus hastatus]|uniref:nuclear body protein SP140-like protein isoform X2 n=1 Tax=Phyllostomus hastatus TaxID=9423 RepID=UPI001E68056D|nr:nuclear body protein SP140-like protein isoform X2 [Phyllostomus hastatus]
MASGGSDLSTRMFAKQNRFMCEIAFKHFKERKVEISDAIKTPFPFLETLHDRGFITNKVYNESKKSCENLSAVPKVVYAILYNMEERCHLPLLEILFSEFLMKSYPDLNGICEGFRDVILKEICDQASVKEESTENPIIQLSLERGTGENSYPCLSWLFPDQSNYKGTAPPDNRLPEHLTKTKDIKMKTNIINDNDALESQQANEQCAQVSEPAGVELPHHGIPVNPFCLHLKDTMKETPFFNSGSEWKAQARSGGNQESDIIEISSDESAECRNREEPPEASTSALKRKPGFMDLGNNSALQKPKRRRARQQPGVFVNFRAQILRVACGEMKGLLIRRKLERGATRKCIRTEDGNWFTPREFEVRGGYEKASNWKTSLTCSGKTLKQLMELRLLLPPPKTFCKGKKEGNSDKCVICLDGGKLFRCGTCYRFFHGDCHLPPVDTKRKSWNCTFCRIGNSSGCQQHYRKSEILVKLMGPEEKLKCEFLLLKVYYHLENNVFPSIPRENYVRKASQCVGKLRKLDIIKKKLIKGNYPQVEDFVWAMENFFWDPKQIYLYLKKEEFMKDFKEIFAIRDTN